MKIWTLYLVENTINNKVYIGITAEGVHKRKTKHLNKAKNGSDVVFHRAIRKHGQNAFIWTALKCFNTREEAAQEEIYWIAQLKDYNIKIYNMTVGGDGTVGFHHTEEAKRKTGEANKGKLSGNNNPQYGKRGKLSPNWGRKRSEKSKDKMRGANNPNYGKKGPANHLFGTRVSQETINKRKETKKINNKPVLSGKDHPNYGKPRTQATKNKISATRRGKSYPTTFVPVNINDVYYESLTKAAQELNLSVGTIRGRIVSKNKKYINWKWTNGKGRK